LGRPTVSDVSHAVRSFTVYFSFLYYLIPTFHAIRAPLHNVSLFAHDKKLFRSGQSFSEKKLSLCPFFFEQKGKTIIFFTKKLPLALPAMTGGKIVSLLSRDKKLLFFIPHSSLKYFAALYLKKTQRASLRIFF